MAPSAYLDGLRMLGRRELSERQLRDRLARKAHSSADIDDAVERLRAERALDDRRVADAIARTEASIKRRGRLRAVRRIESAGIDRDTARRAAAEVFGAIDDEVSLEAALAKRLRGRDRITDDKEWRRLYRFLVGQGFAADRVVRALKATGGRRTPDE